MSWLWGLAVRVFGKRLVALLVPVAVLAVPVLLAVALVLAPVASGRLHVTADAFELVGPPDRALWIAFGCGLVVVLVAAGYVLATQVVLVRAELDERPVSVRYALRAAARPAPAVAMLLGLAAGVVTLGGAATVALTDRFFDEKVWLALVLLTPFGCWLLVRVLVAVPMVVLMGVGPLSGVGAAHRALWGRAFPYAGSVLLIHAGAMAGLIWLTEWLLAPVEVGIGVAAGTLAGVPAMVVAPIWACLLTVVLVNPLPPSKHDADPPAYAEDPPEPSGQSPLRARALPLVVAALVLPGLLLTGLARLNPTGLPTTARIASPYEAEPTTVRLLDDRTATVIRPAGGDGFEIAFCDRTACPPEQSFGYDLAMPEHALSVAPLRDGSVAIAAWVSRSGADADRDQTVWELRLFHCDRNGCPTIETPTRTPVLARYKGAGEHLLVQDVAVSADGQIVVAATFPRAEDQAEQEEDEVEHVRPELVTCADVSCANPRRQTIYRELYTWTHGSSQPWDLALTPDGRPLLVGFDRRTDERIVTVTCGTRDCRRPNVETTPPPAEILHPNVKVAVGVDGRPVTAYSSGYLSSVDDVASYVVGCHDTRCARTTVQRLPTDQTLVGVGGGPGGTPNLAVRDPESGRVTIVACHGRACAERRPVAIPSVRPPGRHARPTTDFSSDNAGWLLVGKQDAEDDESGIRYAVTTIPAPDDS